MINPLTGDDYNGRFYQGLNQPSDHQGFPDRLFFQETKIRRLVVCHVWDGIVKMINILTVGYYKKTIIFVEIQMMEWPHGVTLVSDGIFVSVTKDVTNVCCQPILKSVEKKVKHKAKT